MPFILIGEWHFCLKQVECRVIDVSKAKRKNTANGVGYISVPVPHNEGDEVIIAINYDRAWTEECQSYVGTRSSTALFQMFWIVVILTVILCSLSFFTSSMAVP